MIPHESPPNPELELWATRRADEIASNLTQEQLGALMKALHQKAGKKTGRPKGSGEDDSEALSRLKELVTSGKTFSTALSEISAEHPSHARSAFKQRLRRKWTAEIKELEPKRTLERQKILDALFAEDVAWDL
jgi:type II secretory pathway component PulF